MARVTVEDCVDKVSNRFDLVLLAAHRARTLSTGSSPLVERERLIDVPGHPLQLLDQHDPDRRTACRGP